MNCEKTNYKKLYEKTYWGRSMNSSDEIIKNRNHFISLNNIKNIVRKNTKVFDFLTNMKKRYNFMDHVEVYKLNNSEYIILISIYGLVLNEKEWLSVPCMYLEDCNSYMMNVKNLNFI